MIIATQIREGMVIRLNDELYRVTWVMHRTPGKGDACMQTKLKNIVNQKNMEHRFRSSDKVDRVDVKTESMQFLYKEHDQFVFMHDETFEQLHVADSLIEFGDDFLKEGESYAIQVVDAIIVGIEWPKTMVFVVTEAPPEIKRATATSSLRPVVLENGMTVNAPGFIKNGDTIRINTTDKSYVERV